MSWLVGTRKSDALWAVTSAEQPPEAAMHIALDGDRIESHATDIVTRAVEGISDPIWQIELAATAYVDERPNIGPAQQFVDALLASDEQLLAMKLPSRAVAARTVFAAQAELAKAGKGHLSLSNRIRRSLSLLVAMKASPLTLVALILRYGGSSPRRLPTFDKALPLLAVHGEDSNRTRHMRRALVESAPKLQPKIALLLGRPRGTVTQAAHALDPDAALADVTFVRPLSLLSALAALPAMIGHFARGYRSLRNAHFLPTFGEMFATSYRFAQGSAHAAWWRRIDNRARTETVLFAHTGTADTSLLERAMQTDDAKTVHVVHGTNIGWSFAGISNEAWFLSKPDADLARALPGYGQPTHQPAARPARRDGDGRWLLLTSYAHPYAVSYAEKGVAPDCELIDWMARAADAHGQPRNQVVWRPHPMLAQVEEKERRKLLDAVAEAGFAEWPKDLPYEGMADFSVIVTTPSTVMTDALRLGKTPIVAATAPLQRDLLYARYPLLADDYDRFSGFVASSLERDQADKLFKDAWESIEPATAINLRAMTEGHAAS